MNIQTDGRSEIKKNIRQTKGQMDRRSDPKNITTDMEKDRQEDFQTDRILATLPF